MKDDAYYLQAKLESNQIEARKYLLAIDEHYQQAQLHGVNESLVIEYLFKAIQLGSEEAINYFLAFIDAKGIVEVTLLERLTRITKEQHTYSSGAAIAATICSQIYAGKWIAENNDEITPTIAFISDSQRAALAIYYANQAIELKSESARIFLITAYTTGNTPYIKADREKRLALYAKLIHEKHQAAMLEFGCWQLGLLPNGNPLPTPITQISCSKLDYNKESGLQLLLQATNGSNMTIANTAIDLFCTHSNSNTAAEQIINEGENSNAFIALYLAYSFCPNETKPHIEQNLVPPNSFLQLFSPAVQSTEKAAHYLAKALNSSEPTIQAIARKFASLLLKDNYSIIPILRR